MSFKLHEQLENDSFYICDLDLSQVRLINDAQYPWLILVPKCADITEIIDLSEQEQMQLWSESSRLSQVIREVCKPDKLNVAMIGNVVSQLHVHHIARFKSDAVWPKPVWGQNPMKPYLDNEAEQFIQKIKEHLK